ncbi:MAG: hypothetical protein H3C28_03435 [Sphingomonadales bacterium]|nr:hypothetical protein [Sphingomonadales bacterium]
MTLMMTDIVQNAIAHALVDRFERRPYFPLSISNAAELDAPRVTLALNPAAGTAENDLAQCKLTLSLRDAAAREERVLHSLLELIGVLHNGNFDCRPYVVVDVVFERAAFVRQEQTAECSAVAEFAVSCLDDS